MDHPLSKHPLHGSGEFDVKLVEDNEEDVSIDNAAGGRSGFGNDPSDESKYKVNIPMEFDGLYRSRSGGGQILSEETRRESYDHLFENKFVQVTDSGEAGRRKKTKSLDDPLRQKSEKEDSSLGSNASYVDFTFPDLVIPTVNDSIGSNECPSAGSPNDIKLTERTDQNGKSSGSFIVSALKVLEEEEDTSKGTDEPAAVVRTIADFVWLDTRLRARYEGLLVPCLPNLMNAPLRIRLGDAYEEFRRFSLERYLHRVISHPVLGGKEEVKAFVGVDSLSQWKIIRSEPITSPGDEAIATSLGIRKEQHGMQQLLRWISYRFWQIGRRIDEGLDFLLKKGREEDSLARDVTAKSLEQLRESFEALGQALTEIRRSLILSLETTDNHRKESAKVQKSIEKLGKVEGKETKNLLALVADAFEPLESTQLQETVHTRSPVTPAESLLLEVLTDYVNMFQNVRNILSRRFTEREAYEHASTTYTKLLAKLEKREGAWTTDSRGQQPEKSVADDRALREAVSNAATDLAEFRKHYQNVINVTFSELQRYRQSLETVLESAFRDLAHERVRYYKEKLQKWETIAAECPKGDYHLYKPSTSPER
uniref:PX domain-containing protein n=1 Tax=Rhodosorus marinus TaxID=101924 RepID=A0A7S2ZRR7_9RHOD|mmetsp:Transcript_30296/g.116186  ORF Transcript_30296/g.116186 Transcript_30296/m.116186 type:complete len:596 (+) Transcript_30296:93-1880(+)